MRLHTLKNGAVVALLASTLLTVAAPAALAEDTNQAQVRAIVGVNDPCPQDPPATSVPVFRAGATMAICLAQPLTSQGPTNITVNKMSVDVELATSDRIVVPIPDQPGPGIYTVSGTVRGSALSGSLIQYFPSPRPTLGGLSASTVARGENVRIDGENLDAPLSKIAVNVGAELADVIDVDPNGKWLVASVHPRDNAPAEVLQPVTVTVWNVPASPQTKPLLLSVKGTDARQTFSLAFLAALPLLIVLVLILLLYYISRPGSRNLVAALLYDSATQTYSLSRAQFLWWLLVVAYAYSFLFIGRGLTTGDWTFPAMSGVLFTLLLSTATLLGAIGTSKVRGDKGSGAVMPAPSDLIMHGGVIAPERIQQLLWTLLAGIAVIWIVITTYQTAIALPEIPTELLALMGLSSAAYLTGKVIRSPGPIIRHVDPRSGTTPLELVVSGSSLDKDGTVTVGGTALPKDHVTVLSPAEGGAAADANQQLVSQLKLKLVEPVSWTEKTKIVIVNLDGQRSEWPTPATPPQPEFAVAPDTDDNQGPAIAPAPA
jgi:hypothetical protein